MKGRQEEGVREAQIKYRLKQQVGICMDTVPPPIWLRACLNMCSLQFFHLHPYSILDHLQAKLEEYLLQAERLRCKLAELELQKRILASQNKILEDRAAAIEVRKNKVRKSDVIAEG
jgi:hypothetical protein